jgi:tripeptidyl-peptidase I
MQLHHLSAALSIGLVLGTSASPLISKETTYKKREVPSTHVLHERHVPQLAARWSKWEKLSAKTMVPVRIGLKQYNLDAGHDRLMEISDKSSVNYGKHMTPEEVIDFFAPPQDVVDIVRDWVAQSGIKKERIGHSTNKQVCVGRRHNAYHVS